MWIPDRNTTETVTKEAASRSYEVQTENSRYCCNCQQIIPLPAQPNTTSADTSDANTVITMSPMITSKTFCHKHTYLADIAENLLSYLADIADTVVDIN